MAQSASNADPTAFGRVHVVCPTGQHTHTAIFLHGRGHTGEELAEELFHMRMSDGRSLQQALKGYRFVFPTARSVWSCLFNEYTPAWLETFFFASNVDRHAVVANGITDAVQYLKDLIEAETALLGGRSNRVILAGMSEGGSVGMWTLFCLPLQEGQRFGGFIGINTALPFAASIKGQLQKSNLDRSEDSPAEDRRRQDDFVNNMLLSAKPGLGRGSQLPLLQTPVFLAHGTDNTIVDVERGREACDTFHAMGFRPSWYEYIGAEEEGHWIKEPEEMDDIYRFICSAQCVRCYESCRLDVTNRIPC